LAPDPTRTIAINEHQEKVRSCADVTRHRDRVTDGEGSVARSSYSASNRSRLAVQDLRDSGTEIDAARPADLTGKQG
jgi:hypothetical protein